MPETAMLSGDFSRSRVSETATLVEKPRSAQYQSSCRGINSPLLVLLSGKRSSNDPMLISPSPPCQRRRTDQHWFTTLREATPPTSAYISPFLVLEVVVDTYESPAAQRGVVRMGRPQVVDPRVGWLTLRPPQPPTRTLHPSKGLLCFVLLVLRVRSSAVGDWL